MRVLLRTPWNGPWRRFSDPRRLIVARTTDEVSAALADADAAVAQGHYVAGFVSYEAAAAFGLPAHAPQPRLPLVMFGVFDKAEPLPQFPKAGTASVGPWLPTIDHDEYLERIAAIKARIEAGDTYQINFTFRLRAPFSGDPAAVMRDLHAAQAGPWGAFVETDDHAICSASPELFFSLDGHRVVCRPMKGTAPRGYWPDDDRVRAEDLHASEKNRAENVMVVDMVRNDLGRIAQLGTVHARSLFDVERYPLQWQMTSTVDATVERPSLARLFAAMFPCGSITGAPKGSSMGIIRALETTPRGVYTGAIGYASPHGRAHFNVAIRTVVIDRQDRQAEFGVGSGVVWDSTDRDEYEECLLKADMLMPAAVSRPRSRGASYVLPEGPVVQLLETMLWTPEDGYALLDRHLARLAASAACFGFACRLDDVRGQLEDAVRGQEAPRRVRVMLDVEGRVLCEAVELASLRKPLRVALAAEPIDQSDVFLYHKTTRRDVYDRARASRPRADTVLLWNRDGEVTEGTEANLVIEKNGVRLTPPIACGLLPGTLREELLASGELTEGRISIAELHSAERIWLINSVRGWVPAEVEKDAG